MSRCLIIANQHYRDPAYPELPGTLADADALESVMADTAIAGFDVQLLRDVETLACKKAIEHFFATATTQDLLVLHLLCHGERDLRDQLYFIGSDSEKGYLASTAISAAFINDQMEHSFCNRTVLLLDCCYTGASAKNMRIRGTDTVDITGSFAGTITSTGTGNGRVVITASTALNFKGNSEARSRNPAEPSLFTAAVVHGLGTGEAGTKDDDRISSDDLYRYVHRAVTQRAPAQAPTRSINNVQGTIYLARNVAVSAAGHTQTGIPYLPPPPPPEPWRRWALVGALAVLLLGGIGIAVVVARQLTAPPPPGTGLPNTSVKFAPGSQASLPFPNLSKPTAVAVDAAGDVFVADTGTDRVYKLAAGSSTPTTLSLPDLKYPIAIAADAAGDLYVADTGNSRVLRLAAGASHPTTVTYHGFPQALAADKDGNLYIADQRGWIIRLTAGSWTSITLPFPVRVGSLVAVDNSGNVYVAAPATPIVRLAPGSLTPTPVPFPQFSTVDAIGVDGKGNVYAAGDPASSAASHLWRLAAGSTTPTVMPVTGEMRGLAIDTMGDAFVIDTMGNTVWRFAPTD